MTEIERFKEEVDRLRGQNLRLAQRCVQQVLFINTFFAYPDKCLLEEKDFKIRLLRREEIQ